MSLHPGEQGVCSKHGDYDEFCGPCADEKQNLTAVHMNPNTSNTSNARDHIVAASKRAKTTDSKRETENALKEVREMTNWLRLYCPHDLVVILKSEGHDYDENCAIPACHMCVRCGLEERGYHADIDKQNYIWCSGTFKKLVKQPFARFEPGPSYSTTMPTGRWDKGNPLDTDLDELVSWIKKAGYSEATPEWYKNYDERKKKEKAEVRYQAFKAENIERLRKEFTEESNAATLEQLKEEFIRLQERDQIKQELDKC